MSKLVAVIVIIIWLSAFQSSSKSIQKNKWISLFDGKSLYGWKVGANPETFSVENGMIVAGGSTAHLFYDGPVMNHDFRNFELEAQIMTFPGSKSGIYFHTVFQDKSWPHTGYEVQVNNSNPDFRKSGSLYYIVDVKDTLVKDNEWFTENIMVQGKRIIVKVNDKTVVDYTEPEAVQRDSLSAGKLISHGTFALQGHDPKSKVLYKNIVVRPLP
jgi:Domain of Unknown Function (DUF1080)